MLLEYKDNLASVKDVDTKNRVITGYLSNFGNIDKDNDVITKGAFAKTVSERKEGIFFLNQHNWKQPHGTFSVLQEDQKGLYFESNPLPDTSYSNDVIKLYEAGIMKEHSIGFNVLDHEMKEGVRMITSIKLWEGSNVTIGANSDTPFTGFKSTIEEIEDHAKLIYKAIRSGDFTDETFTLLEYALKNLQREAYELGKKALARPFTDTSYDKPLEIIKEFNETFK